MRRRQSMLLATWALLLTTALMPGAALASGLHGWGWGWGHRAAFQSRGPLLNAGVLPIGSGFSTGTGGTTFTSPLSTAGFVSSPAGVSLASGTTVYYYPAGTVLLTTSPLSNGTQSVSPATPAAPVTSPLSGLAAAPAGMAGAAAGMAAVSLADVDLGAVTRDYNAYAATELAQARAAGMAGIAVPAAELNGLTDPNGPFAAVARLLGGGNLQSGGNNLHGIIRFLRTKTGDPADFQKTARGLFGQVLGGALQQAPEVALRMFGPTLDTLIGQYIPGFHLFSQLGQGTGTSPIGTGNIGTSPKNPLYVQMVPPGGAAGQMTIPDDPAREAPTIPRPGSPFFTSPPPDPAAKVLEFIRGKVAELQVATDGTMTGKTKDGKKFRIPPGQPPELIDN